MLQQLSEHIVIHLQNSRFADIFSHLFSWVEISNSYVSGHAHHFQKIVLEVCICKTEKLVFSRRYILKLYPFQDSSFLTFFMWPALLFHLHSSELPTHYTTSLLPASPVFNADSGIGKRLAFSRNNCCSLALAPYSYFRAAAIIRLTCYLSD